MIITIDLDIPIGFILDDCRGGLCDAVQTPGLYSFCFGVVDGAGRIKQLGVGNDETEVVLVMDVA
jgi:hypothetical protein